MIHPFIGHYEGYDHANGFETPLAKVQQQVRALYDGSVVKRFHTMPTVTENTVGQHSHGVAMLCYLMAGEACSVNLLMAALTHDLAEQYVGDVPSPSKRALNVREQLGQVEDALLDTVGMSFSLTPDEELVLKLADCADGMMFCAKERMLGNRSKMVRFAYRNYGTYVHEAMHRLPNGALYEQVGLVFKAVSRLWKENKGE